MHAWDLNAQNGVNPHILYMLQRTFPLDMAQWCTSFSVQYKQTERKRPEARIKDSRYMRSKFK